MKLPKMIPSKISDAINSLNFAMNDCAPGIKDVQEHANAWKIVHAHLEAQDSELALIRSQLKTLRQKYFWLGIEERDLAYQVVRDIDVLLNTP